MTKFDLVLGDEWTAFYKDGKLVAEGEHLSAFDLLEAVGVPVDVWTADLEWSAAQDQQYPQDLNEVVMDGTPL